MNLDAWPCGAAVKRLILSYFTLGLFCLTRSNKMGHSSKSLGLHRRKQSGQLPEACSQQNPQFQGRLNQFNYKSSYCIILSVCICILTVYSKHTVLTNVVTRLHKLFWSLSFVYFFIHSFYP